MSYERSLVQVGDLVMTDEHGAHVWFDPKDIDDLLAWIDFVFDPNGTSVRIKLCVEYSLRGKRVLRAFGNVASVIEGRAAGAKAARAAGFELRWIGLQAEARRLSTGEVDHQAEAPMLTLRRPTEAEQRGLLAMAAAYDERRAERAGLFTKHDEESPARDVTTAREDVQAAVEWLGEAFAPPASPATLKPKKEGRADGASPEPA